MGPNFTLLVEPLIVPLRPLYLIFLVITFLPQTFLSIIKTAQIPTSWSSFKDRWFAIFWTWFGVQSKANHEVMVRPLLTHATGTVLDIGSGQGHFLCLYDPKKIKKLLAVEPNKSHHEHLKQNAAEAGFVYGSNFEILDSLIETLETQSGIKRYSVDTIVTLQCLCSIPNPQVLIPELRTYLKRDGGKWIVFEHVQKDEHEHPVIAKYQSLLNYVWPQFFNGCSLTRNTKGWIEATGNWKKKQDFGGLKPLADDSPWTAIPTVSGVLISA